MCMKIFTISDGCTKFRSYNGTLCHILKLCLKYSTVFHCYLVQPEHSITMTTKIILILISTRRRKKSLCWNQLKLCQVTYKSNCLSRDSTSEDDNESCVVCTYLYMVVTVEGNSLFHWRIARPIYSNFSSDIYKSTTFLLHKRPSLPIIIATKLT